MWPTFPEFVNLSLEDKNEYNKLVVEHSPFSDLSFTTLHIWWNLNEKLAISLLDGNLIIDYQNPYDEKNSGLCVIGKSNIYESIHTIFEYQKRRGDKVRLVHVPEFVLKKVEDTEREKLNIEEEVDYNEYIVDSEALSSLTNSDLGRVRRKVKRFLREVEDRSIEIRSLDLTKSENREIVFASIAEWQKKYPKENDPEATENKAIITALTNCDVLEMCNICLFIDGELQGVTLFHVSHDKKYYIVNHLKVNYATPFIFDYMTHLLAAHAHKHSVPYLNMEMDLGIDGLRQHKMGLRPIEFFRKYIISPK